MSGGGIDWQGLCGSKVVAGFGQAALYIPRDGSPTYTVTGVFDQGYKQVSLLEPDAPTTDAKPVIGINDSQCQGTPWDQDDRLQIPPGTGTTYIVSEARPDGHGITKLILAKCAAYPP